DAEVATRNLSIQQSTERAIAEGLASAERALHTRRSEALDKARRALLDQFSAERQTLVNSIAAVNGPLLEELAYIDALISETLQTQGREKGRRRPGSVGRVTPRDQKIKRKPHPNRGHRKPNHPRAPRPAKRGAAAAGGDLAKPKATRAEIAKRVETVLAI